MSQVITPEEMVAEVTQEQKANGYTDQQMADIFGCSRQTYLDTRRGKKKVGNAYFNGAMKFLGSQKPEARSSGVIERKTGETDIRMELNIDGTGKWEIDTGIYMFDHLLSQVIKHGRFDLELKASGDDPHHLIEDVAICLGQAFLKALGGRTGITRMGDATVPLDDALAMVSVDLGGRAYSVLEMSFTGNDMAGFPSDLVRHFLETFAVEGRLNLHAHILYGTNDHHRAEALFKALGRALDMATAVDERTKGISPSTKGMLEGADE
jgi:imidazoleglycerol-phosphate dehydratase